MFTKLWHCYFIETVHDTCIVITRVKNIVLKLQKQCKDHEIKLLMQYTAFLFGSLKILSSALPIIWNSVIAELKNLIHHGFLTVASLIARLWAQFRRVLLLSQTENCITILSWSVYSVHNKINPCWHYRQGPCHSEEVIARQSSPHVRRISQYYF